jgi:Macrocin-O-methyltransferase (TylF)
MRCLYRGGILSWIKLSDILEPTAFNRQVIGFDTFSGFPSTHKKDTGSRGAKTGDVAFAGYEHIQNAISFADKNALLRPKPKGILVKGDFMETAAKFLEQNQHVLVSLLYLDFDIYEPTKKALELFLPRMHRGSIIGFDEINNSNWPGETIAALEELNIHDYSIEKFYYEPHMAYAILK